MLIKLPARFTLDHIDRCCAAGLIMSKDSKTIILDSTPEQIDCLLSDADYYIEMAAELDKCYLGLVSSARATKRAIERANA